MNSIKVFSHESGSDEDIQTMSFELEYDKDVHNYSLTFRGVAEIDEFREFLERNYYPISLTQK